MHSSAPVGAADFCKEVAAAAAATVEEVAKGPGRCGRGSSPAPRYAPRMGVVEDLIESARTDPDVRAAVEKRAADDWSDDTLVFSAWLADGIATGVWEDLALRQSTQASLAHGGIAMIQVDGLLYTSGQLGNAVSYTFIKPERREHAVALMGARSDFSTYFFFRDGGPDVSVAEVLELDPSVAWGTSVLSTVTSLGPMPIDDDELMAYAALLGGLRGDGFFCHDKQILKHLREAYFNGERRDMLNVERDALRDAFDGAAGYFELNDSGRQVVEELMGAGLSLEDALKTQKAAHS